MFLRVILMQGGDGLAGVPGRENRISSSLQSNAFAMHSCSNVPSVNILAGKQPQDADLLPCLNTLSTNLKLACSHAGLNIKFSQSLK